MASVKLNKKDCVSKDEFWEFLKEHCTFFSSSTPARLLNNMACALTRMSAECEEENPEMSKIYLAEFDKIFDYLSERGYYDDIRKSEVAQ